MLFRFRSLFQKGGGHVKLDYTDGKLYLTCVDENGNIVRKPSGKKEKGSAYGFTLNGYQYASLESLTASAVDKNRNIYKDTYGHTVLAVRERYPIFDSYDAASENRYYRWYYVLLPECWSCVYYDDGTGKAEITEDVSVIPYNVSKAMVEIYRMINKDGRLLV